MKKISLMMVMLLAALSLSAQNIRYVSKDGAYANDGSSWEMAKINIQDAINDLGTEGGFVFVAKGTYTPTESTERTGGSTLYMSFKIPAGVKVYGGFAGTETGSTPEEIIGQRVATATELGSFYWPNKTVLSGNLSANAVFSWSNAKKQYETTFYGNTYHVVWFANNGFEEKEVEGQMVLRAKGLAQEAVLDGFTVTGGHAYNTSVTGRTHNAYGGGAYMVKGSTVSHCEFVNCDASRDGGAIYMDGGGTVDWSFVHNCQALGLGVLSGFGGGICMDGGESKVLHTAFINNVGRMGGGLAVNYRESMSDNKLGMMVAASVMASNVATTEGGGAYLNEGGIMDNCTVVRNECNGTGVTTNGMTTGRAAGVYIRDFACVYNSVLWGGSCKANKDIQYANSRADVTNGELKPQLHYVAMNEADIVDWSGTVKDNVFKLSKYNAEGDVPGGETVSESEGFPLFAKPATKAGHGTETSDPDKWQWHTRAMSALNHRGIRLADLGVTSVAVQANPISIKAEPYIAHCTLGAYISETPAIEAADPTGSPKIFVDPNTPMSGTAAIGASWDHPVQFLADALYAAKKDYSGKHVTIYVKEGTVENISSTFTGSVRDMVYEIPDNVTLLGGYPEGLEGTDVADAKRNPVKYPTILTARITKDYASNARQLISLKDITTGVTIDGFQLRYANAEAGNGAAILLDKAQNVNVKNVLVASCTAGNGAAVYATNNSRASFENCIFHNNTVEVADTKAVIYTDATSSITFDHGDVLRNIGHGFVNANTTTASTITNSVFYANMQERVEDTNDNASKATWSVSGSFAGSHNLFDTQQTSLDASLGQAVLTFTFDDGHDSKYPRMVNPTKNSGVSTGGDITYYGRAASFQPTNTNPMVNAALATGANTAWGKDMTNTITRDYGGLPDIGAIENHQATIAEEGDNAYSDGQPKYGSVIYVRDYGSTPLATPANNTNRVNTTWGNIGQAATGFAPAVTPLGGTSVQMRENYQTNVNATGTIISQNVTGLTDGLYIVELYANATYTNGRGFNSEASAGDLDVAYVFANDVVVPVPVKIGSNVGGTNGEFRLPNVLVQGGTLRLGIGKWKAGTNWHTIQIKSLQRIVQGGDLATTTPDGSPRDGSSWERAINGNSGYQGVNGLQYAVNRAEELIRGTGYDVVTKDTANYKTGGTNNIRLTYNKVKAGSELVQVWVGAGTYTNAAGVRGTGLNEGAKQTADAAFEARNHVKVYGAFPKTGNPGMNERHPQLTVGVTNSEANASINVADYETILQAATSLDANTNGLRVLKHPDESIPIDYANNTGSCNTPRNHLVYEDVLWDGFTIRHGKITSEGGRSGGAGVKLLENFTLTNCVVRDNSMASGNTGGRGNAIFCEGGIINNCYVMNNTCGNMGQLFGTIYAIAGEIFNTVVTGNSLANSDDPSGSAIFIEDAKFYNNTLVNNKGAVPVAMYPASAGKANLDIYNTIIIADGNYINRHNNSLEAKLYNCYIPSDQTEDWLTLTDCFTGSGLTNPFAKDLADANSTYDYRLDPETSCINHGTENIGEASLPGFDMDYTDRIQDCRVDIGAYEFNGAYSIQPDITTVPGQAIYYVTPEGYGTSSAIDPANAACASKLQKVLDAAGRYKHENTGTQVIVKVANDYALANDADPKTYFKYYATRTTDTNDQNVRVWSIIIPKGVEVWGGYTDVASNHTRASWSNTDNGFYRNATQADVDNDLAENVDDKIDLRNITGNPTYFDSYYENKVQNSSAYTYHVVTFANKYFDENGLEDTGKDMAGVTDRAVIDGIFITGGKADGESYGSEAARNINQYGGAAIVTDYAHVRNCIVTGNQATYGGALALTHEALVSGTLFLENEAEYGGALYVFEDKTVLSNGTTVDTKSTNGVIDQKMAHVYTSTIVNNNANTQGGGLWFVMDDDANVRINSCVLWQNDSPDQANVAGAIAPGSEQSGTSISTEMFYPFAYSAVQNQRMPGTNNIQISTSNTNGGRFALESATNPSVYNGVTIARNDNEFAYYGLTNYSALLQSGMPITEYDQLVTNKGLSPIDFMRVDRKISSSNTRTYIEIGARSLDKLVNFDWSNLMLRLYVSEPQYTNMDAAEVMMAIAEKPEEERSANEKMYMQMGSSFAYPFQKLDEALEYIYQARKNESLKGKTNNIPFEIFVGKGEYHPTRDLMGNYGYSLANTFLVPEGVSIYGGFDSNQHADDNAYHGQFNRIKTDAEGFSTDPGQDGYYFLTKNVISRNTGTDVNNDSITITASVGGVERSVKFYQRPYQAIIPTRPRADINANNIIEPWEFKNETVLSGAATNVDGEGVYHVITILADENLVGPLPVASVTHENATPGGQWYNYKDVEYGAYDYEEGQTITLNGLKVTGGRALNYHSGTLDGDLGIYSYYHGGGLLVDGNRYSDFYNKQRDGKTAIPGPVDVNGNRHDLSFDNEKAQYLHTGIPNAVAFRDIPVSIEACKFTNNQAGYGGAINSNGTIDIFNSSLEQNMAVGGSDVVKYNLDGEGEMEDLTVQYPGNGGAAYGTHQISMFNTLLANNEAANASFGITPSAYLTLRNQNSTDLIYGGAGGAVYTGRFSCFHFVNCNFVRNQANMYPAVFTMNPNRDYSSKYLNGATLMTPYYSQFNNTLFWGNKVNPTMSERYKGNPKFNFNAKLICNYGRALRKREEMYNTSWDTGNTDIPNDQSQLDNLSLFSETAWFCAYEDGQGITPKNLNDLRDVDYSPIGYANDQIAAAGDYQNCNIMLSGINDDLDGPNFVSPSNTAGVAGYTESADWSPARINNLTDQGSGKIMQTISIIGDSYRCDFDTYTDASQVASLWPNRPYTSPESPGYSLETTGDYITSGAYTMTRYLRSYPKYNENLMLGEDYYMKSATTQQMLYRISYDPNPTHNQTYIDIGVYEYPHTELQYTTEGDEVDIIWVSSAEKPDNGLPDGSDWTQPTSDLQRAIETLLSSRNGHRKEIRLMDGQYTPIYTIDGNLSFYFNTEYVNQSVMMPKGWELIQQENPGGLSIKSFTIKGGYSRDQMNMFNTEAYPAIIKGQTRTDASGNQWNHAFYIKDAIQRYGNNVTDDNGQGAFGIYEKGQTPEAKVIPIEISGITFVNDQALSNTDGAAIRYEDQALHYNGQRFATGTYVPTSPTMANIRRVTYYTDGTFTTPAAAGTITEFAKYGGVRRYYTNANYLVQTEEETEYWKEEGGYVTRPASETDPSVPAKFILSNSKVIGSGTHYDALHQSDKSSSAVYIGTGGGYALFYNDVMHSNYGNPLVSMCPTDMINNTIALNAGLVDLGGEITLDQNGTGNQDGPMLAPQRRLTPAAEPLPAFDSRIFNSIFWRNNPVSSTLYGPQFSLPGYTEDANGKDKFMRNAYTYNTGKGADLTPYTDYTDLSENGDLKKLNFNVHISNENKDLIHGPNFTDPENADIMQRNFTLQPSLRMLNKGDMNLYRDLLGFDYSTKDPFGYDHTDVYNIYSYAWETQTQYDAAHSMRVMFTNIDLGAYEYQQALNRVLYVDPNGVYNAGQEGMSWENALGGSSIQLATDLAGLYHVNNSDEQAYVFVKGNTELNIDKDTEENLVLRDGVVVIGSLDPNDNTEAKYTEDENGVRKYTNLDEYVRYVLDKRRGVAAPNGNKTILHGIRTSENTKFDYIPDDKTYAMADGFVVSAGEVSAPVIDVNPQSATNSKAVVALRNIIVADNTVTTDNTNVVNLGNALLYEVLMHHNTPGANGVVLNLTDGGYLVSGTIEGKMLETTGYGTVSEKRTEPSGTGANARTFNSLVNYGSEPWISETLSGENYPINFKEGYRKPDADLNLNYQLAEGSLNIDACATGNPLTGITAAGDLKQFINYATDRDLMGNPRLLQLGTEHTNYLDRGAFETWRVSNAVVTTSGTAPTYVDGTYTAGMHSYPHDGSVVYILAGNSLVSGHDLKPGYLLVQSGGNLFGQGYKVDASFLAVERQVKADGTIVSMPFEMDYNADVTMMVKDDETGIITLTRDEPDVYRYNGLMRSGWNYDITDSNSPCWDPFASDQKAAAGEGVLYTPAAKNGGKVYRFTGNSGSFTDYIYTEEGDSKEVILTQYNDGGRNTHENGNTGANADFTDMDDMGWNAIGLPYLVSDYNPAATETFTGNNLYNMHIPHELWLYYDGMVALNGTEQKTKTGFYAVNSWENSAAGWHLNSGAPSIWVGEGFFTQTATLDETETVTFFRPVYVPASPVKTERWYLTDNLEEISHEGAYIVATRYYTPDGIQLTKPQKGVTIAVDVYSDGSTRSRKYLNKK